MEGDLATLLASPPKAVGNHEVPDGFGPAHNTADSRESWRSFIGFKLIDNPESRFPLILRIIQVNLPQTHQVSGQLITVVRVTGDAFRDLLVGTVEPSCRRLIVACDRSDVSSEIFECRFVRADLNPVGIRHREGTGTRR